MEKLKKILIRELTRSPMLQSRVTLNDRIVGEYQSVWENSGKFPPITVFFDGTKNWVADGFHRLLGLEMAKLETPKRDREIDCNVREGCLQEAILYSLSANTQHGLRPTNNDKRRAVLNYWSIGAEYCSHSNNMVAAACRVSHTFVSNMRMVVVATDLYSLASDLGFDSKILGSTISNLKQTGDMIVTQRDGKELVQTKKAKPNLATLQDTGEQDLYISLGTADDNPIARHQIVRGVSSLANPGFLVVDGGQLLPESDAIAIPYPIGTTVATHDDPTRQLIVNEYKLVGTDLKAICHGVNSGHSMTESIDHLQPYNPTPIDLAITDAKQIETNTHNLKKGLKDLEERASTLENNTSTETNLVLDILTRMSIEQLYRLQTQVATEIERRTAEDIPNSAVA